MLELSVCLITRDEEANIERCLASVSAVAEDIVVVDTGSSDRTIDKANGVGARVFRRDWNDDFSEARNYALSQAANDWVLQLDADEALHVPNLTLISDLISRPGAVAYSCQIHNLVRPDTFENAFISRFERLFRRSAYEYQGIIHESPVPRSGCAYTPPVADVHIIHWGYIDFRLQRRKSERNLKLLKKAVATNPDDFFFQYYLGEEYARLGSVHESINAYLGAEKVIAPGNPAYHALLLINLCESLWRAGRLDEAIERVEKAREMFPDYRDMIFLAGKLHAAGGNWREALACFRRSADMATVPGFYLRAERNLDEQAKRKIKLCESQLTLSGRQQDERT